MTALDNVTAPAIPERLRRLPEIAMDLWWTWNAQPRDVFRRLDYPLWRQTAHNPVLMLTLVSQEVLERGGQRRTIPLGLRRRPRRARRARAARRTPGGSGGIPTRRGRSPTSPPNSRSISRCRSTPAASACSPATTARKRATSASRSSASASCIRRATSIRASRRKAGSRKSYERLNVGARADRTGDHARRQAVHHRRAARQSQRARVGVARPPRPREALSARHRSRRERALGSRAVGAPLRRRSRDARPAGDHPRHRRRAGAEGDGLDAGRLAPERRTRRVRRAAADSRPDRARRDRSTSALEEVRRTTVFTTHTPVPAGHDAFPFNLVETHLAGCWGTLGEYRDALHGARRTTTTAAARCST